MKKTLTKKTNLTKLLNQLQELKKNTLQPKRKQAQ